MRVAQRVQRDVVARPPTLHLARFFDGGGVLEAADMVAAPQVGMLQHHARRGSCRWRRAGVVQVEQDAPRAFVGHRQARVDRRRPRAAALQLELDLLGRILVGQAQAGRHCVQVGRGAFARVGRLRRILAALEVRLPLDVDLADGALHHVQAHHAAIEFLLRQVHRDHLVAARVIGRFQRLERRWTSPKSRPLPVNGATARIDLGRRQQRIAANVEAGDIEADGGVGAVGRPGGADGAASTASSEQARVAWAHA